MASLVTVLNFLKRIKDRVPVTVDFTSGDVPVSAITLPLPTGASTEVTLASVLAKLSNDPATQTTLAAILAKIIAAPATEAKQDTGNTSLASVDSKIGTIDARPAAYTELDRLYQLGLKEDKLANLVATEATLKKIAASLAKPIPTTSTTLLHRN